MTSHRRRYVASTSLRRHMPNGNLPPPPPLQSSKPSPPPQYSKPSYAYGQSIKTTMISKIQTTCYTFRSHIPPSKPKCYDRIRLGNSCFTLHDCYLEELFLQKKCFTLRIVKHCFAIPDVKHCFFLYFSIEKVLLAKNREARSTIVAFTFLSRKHSILSLSEPEKGGFFYIFILISI